MHQQKELLQFCATIKHFLTAITYCPCDRFHFHHATMFFKTEDLLCCSLELLDTLLAIPSMDLSASASSDPDLATGLAECLRQLLRGARVGDSVTANRRLWRALQVWIGLVGHVASCQQGRINLGK